MKLILDDDEVRIAKFRKKIPDCICFTNPNEFIRFIRDNMIKIEEMSLDHDLNFFESTPYKREVTGFDVCRAIADMTDLPRDIQIIIHSNNPDGSKRMKWTLEDAGFGFVYLSPFRA